MPLVSETGQASRRAVLTTIVVTLVVLAAATATGVYVAYRHLDHRIQAGDRIHHHAPRSHPDLPDSALNILAMGSDTRQCAGCAIDKEKGEDGSDTTILIHVRDGRRSAYAISLPRDVLVDRPDCHPEDGPVIPGARRAMFNAAYSLGGPECTVEQVEAVTGIRIDDYVTLDMGGFKGMVDAVGGVRVHIPTEIDDHFAHIHFAAGTQTLGGVRALDYVRERHAVGDGSDLGRLRRQQAFIASLTRKVLSAGTLARPVRLYRFADALTGSLRTDPELARVPALVKLATSLRHAKLTGIQFVTAPTIAFPKGDPNWGRLAFTPAASRLWRRVIRDRPLGPFGAGAITAAE
ncbi:LCP family protein [Nocardioides sp. KR10-350]|uniref:LCP family protein n=1 Tax=Nocardioides cheoyonin TaxID=3156615 RepID=UPI0032B318F2